MSERQISRETREEELFCPGTSHEGEGGVRLSSEDLGDINDEMALVLEKEHSHHLSINLMEMILTLSESSDKNIVR
jgi:hypothetical protein